MSVLVTKESLSKSQFMSTSPFFPLPDGLEIIDVRETTDGVIVCVTSHRESSPCPLCSLSSSAIHSFYRRHPQDLPSGCRVPFD